MIRPPRRSGRREPEADPATLARQSRLRADRAEFPGDAATGRLSGDQAAEDRFFEAQSSVPCPALDPEILKRLRRDGGNHSETTVAYAVLAGDEER